MDKISLTQLPPEILLIIADNVGSLCSIKNLAQANHKLFGTLERHLYRHDVLTAGGGSHALTWILGECKLNAASMVRIAKRSIAAGVNIEFFVEVKLPICYVANSRYLTPVRDARSDCATATGAAAAAGCVPLLQTFVEAGAKVNGNSLTGLSPLYFAVRNCRTDAVRFLLSQPGIDLGIPPVKMDTLLSIAVKMSSVEIAKMLLPKVDPNHYQKGLNSPLYLAIEANSYEMVALLLSSKDLRLNDVEFGRYRRASRNLVVNQPITPFAYACRGGCLEIVQLLHDDSRTDVDLCIYGQPPVKGAVGRQDRRILDFLLQSKKITTATDYAFRRGCRHEPPELAQQVLQVATDRDKKYAEKWIKISEQHGHHSLVEQIREKWGDS